MSEKLKIISLGGLNEIGKNITVLEYGRDMIVVDCGMGFPEDDMYGIDSVIADTSYLVKNKNKLRGLFITHGHEDHIGGIPYLMQDLRIPVHGTRLTLGLVKRKLEEFDLADKVKLFTHEAGEVVKAGCFQVEFIHMNHSIADAVAFAIKTPVGTVVMTGDFKIDATASEGIADLGRLGQLGKEGVLALLCDSTNVERPGYSASETLVAAGLERQFKDCDQRIIITTFASNALRLQNIINIAHKYGRKVAVTGRSMENILKVSVERPRTKSSSSPPAPRARICPPSTAWPSPATSRWRSSPATGSSFRPLPFPATRRPSAGSSTSSTARARMWSATSRPTSMPPATPDRRN